MIKDSTQLGYRNPPPSNLQPRADPTGYPPVTGDHRPPDWLPPTTSLPYEPAVASPNKDDRFDNTHVEVSRQPTPPDSKYGKANLNVLKNRLQRKKEVTITVAQTGDAGPHSQSISNYVNTEVPYQGVSDSTTKPVVRKTDLTSLRNRLEKSKEKREEALTAVDVNKKAGDYCNLSEPSQYISGNPVMINNLLHKRPLAGPRTVTPVSHASNDTHSASSTSSSKIAYRLWQCAQCQTVNEAHHTSCEHCKLICGKMADRKIFCSFCQLMMFLPPIRDLTDTCCPRCKEVHESCL